MIGLIWNSPRQGHLNYLLFAFAQYKKKKKKVATFHEQPCRPCKGAITYPKWSPPDFSASSKTAFSPGIQLVCARSLWALPRFLGISRCSQGTETCTQFSDFSMANFEVTELVKKVVCISLVHRQTFDQYLGSNPRILDHFLHSNLDGGRQSCAAAAQAPYDTRTIPSCILPDLYTVGRALSTLHGGIGPLSNSLHDLSLQDLAEGFVVFNESITSYFGGL